jgi:hypothetical protein
LLVVPSFQTAIGRNADRCDPQAPKSPANRAFVTRWIASISSTSSIRATR